MAVEDPFDAQDNTARSVGCPYHEFQVPDFIAGAFERSAEALSCLNSPKGERQMKGKLDVVCISMLTGSDISLHLLLLIIKWLRCWR